MTFDSFGVSGHRNHIAVFKAVKRLKDKGLLQDVTVYFLKSIGMLRKYASLLDLPLSIYSRQVNLSKNAYPFLQRVISNWDLMNLRKDQDPFHLSCFILQIN